MSVEPGKYKVHRVFKGEDKVLGSFEVKDNNLVFSSPTDAHNCDLLSSGPISGYTAQKISQLLDNDHKSIYIEKA